MSFFNKVLASVGIGNAKVDTQLEKTAYTGGELVRGNVVITGGNVAQDIGSIYLSLNTKYVKEVNDNKYYDTGVIASFQVSNAFTVAPNERKEIPFQFELPYMTPVTAGKTVVWLHTGLDIEMAIDPTDEDYITVNPTPLVASVFQAVNNLGFRLAEVENEKPSYKLGTSASFIQEFEYRPTGNYRGYLDELEVTFLAQSANEATFVMQVDRKARGLSGLFAEAFEMDESYVRATVTTNDIPNMQAIIKDLIDRNKH